MSEKSVLSLKPLSVLLLATALFLAACDGQAIQLATDAELEASVDVESSRTTDLSESSQPTPTAAEQSVEAQTAAEAGVEAESELEAETAPEPFPELVLGSPEMHATDPSTVQLASGRVQFIEFFAYWCSTCKAMAPHVHGLEQLYGDRVNFVYLDRDDPATAEFQAELGYIYQPHVFILDGEGNILYQSVYFTEATELQAAIEAALANQ